MTFKDIASGAERVLVPKGEASERCRGAFEAYTDIEIPTFTGEKLKANSQGRTFWLVKGIDIPGLIAKSLADVGTAGTDACLEYPEQAAIRYRGIGEIMCRFSLLSNQAVAAELNEDLNCIDRSARQLIAVATSRPEMLRRLASWQNLPIMPVDLQISGSVEAYTDLAGCKAVADLVETGETARQNELVEVRRLCNVTPEIIVANQRYNYMPPFGKGLGGSGFAH